MWYISADRHTRDFGSKEELFILQDNLDDKLQKKYQYMYQEGDNIFFWYYHPEYTNELDHPDSGAGNQIRFWFRVYLD